MFTLFERVQIEGLMPERALLRFKRAGIPLYDVCKVDKAHLRLRVRRKDIPTMFAIYPAEKGAYSLSRIGGTGLARFVDFCRNRVGLVLGCLAFCILTLAADTFVFGIEFVGTDVYAREVAIALEESGIRLFAPYKSGKEDVVVARLLALDDVEFCSVKKEGGRLRVEMRVVSFTKPTLSIGTMQAKHSGELLSITVLRGSALKKAGDKVQAGEGLVGDWFSTQEGKQVCVEPIARVKIACIHEGVYEGESEQVAFAKAYLSLELTDKDEITDVQITRADNMFHVKIKYVVIESMNI